MDPDNKVYDDHNNDSVPKPILNSLENGDEATDQAGEPAERKLYNPNDSDDKKSLGSDDLDKAEGEAGKGKEGSAAENLLKNGLYNASPELMVAQKFASTIKRKGIMGGLVGLLVAGFCFILFMLFAGPGQLIQLSQVLQGNFKHQENTTSTRGNDLFRYAMASDIGETRVGLLGKQFLRPAVQQLSDIGIEFNPTSTVGLNSVEINTEKLATKYPELNGMSDDEKINRLTDLLNEGGANIEAGQITGSGNNFSVDSSTAPLASDSALGKASLSLLDNGVVDSTIINHVFGDWLGTSSIFHPISKLTQNKLKQLGTTKGQDDEVESEEQTVEAPSLGQGATAVEDVKNKNAEFDSPVSNALLFTGAACFARGVAGDINQVNRYEVVLPAVAVALHFISVGEQVKTGQDASAQQFGAEATSLIGAGGQTVWASQGLQATEGVSSPSGPDISPEDKQAFTGSSSAATIKAWADGALGGSVLAAAACSSEGQFTQAALSIGLSGTSLFDGGLSGAVVLGIKLGESLAVATVAMHFIKQVVVSSNTAGVLSKSAFSGGLGGNLLAYGARTAGNMASIADGGVKLAGTAASQVSYQDQEQSNQQFASEGLFARLFDIDDYRSLFGKMADSMSPSFSQNLLDGIASLSDIGHDLFSSVSSLFIPKTSAATSYDWGVPLYGIPSSILDNPDYANPYTNANDVASILQSDCTDSDGSVDAGAPNCGFDGNLINRALYCFGAVINKDSSGNWDVTMSTDPSYAPVDTTSSTYQGANCDDTSDSTWARMMLFVADTRTMEGIACYQGNSTSCQEAGYNPPGTASPTTTTTSICSPSSSSDSSDTSFFTVVGKSICDQNGKIFIPYGISIIDSLEMPDWCTPQNEAATDAQIQAAAQYWHSNTIRIQVSEDNFENGATCTANGITYTTADAMNRLGTEVNEIENLGMVPMINDNVEFTGHLLYGPTQTTINFWNDVTAYFASQSNSSQYDNIIFDIFNEPSLPGNIWQNGGTYNGTNFVGMQAVIKAIRNGTNLNNNLILVEGAGADHATSLSVLKSYPLTGINLAYAFHHVNLNDPESTWETTMGLDSGVNVPIVDGEWTQYASQRLYECYDDAPANIPTFLNLLQTNGIGMIFWSLEPGVGTVNGPIPQPVTNVITSSFPTTAAGYSQPTTISANYSCITNSDNSLIGQGAGSIVMNYFNQYSQPENSAGSSQ